MQRWLKIVLLVIAVLVLVVVAVLLIGGHQPREHGLGQTGATQWSSRSS
jgi:hypothetical protein